MGNNISAIVLAAGLSTRMGQPKLLLPWGETTVLGQVVSTFAEALQSADYETDKRMKTDFEIVVVTGGAREIVEAEVTRLARLYPVRAVYNPEHASGGMLSSIQAGLAAISPETHAALIGLGDQPQIQAETVEQICAAYIQAGAALVIPSYQNQRGHPWLATRPLWPEILSLTPSVTPREFIHAHAGEILYVAADESVLQDLDTPEEYRRQKP